MYLLARRLDVGGEISFVAACVTALCRSSAVRYNAARSGMARAVAEVTRNNARTQDGSAHDREKK